MQLVIPERNRSFGPVDAMALIGVVGFSIARWIPIATLVPFWGCGIRKMTGVPCPGCGLTRAATAGVMWGSVGMSIYLSCLDETFLMIGET